MKSTAISNAPLRIVTGLALVLCASGLAASAPCGDFGECKALIEINSSDGDIGFHFLMDGDDLNAAQINGPSGVKVFQDQAKGPLTEQKLTETFAESAEPLCWADPDADPDDEIVTLEEFLERWAAGTYYFSGISDGGERSFGATQLSYKMPAAPADVEFDGSKITWDSGDDLGNCASFVELNSLVAAGVLPMHPVDVAVAQWEVVFEPDVEDGDPRDGLKFTVRVAGNAMKQVTVPADYLAYLGPDTPAKVEVGAIGFDDNATFTEEGDLCINEDEGCEDDD